MGEAAWKNYFENSSNKEANKFDPIIEKNLLEEIKFLEMKSPDTKITGYIKGLGRGNQANLDIWLNKAGESIGSLGIIKDESEQETAISQLSILSDVSKDETEKKNALKSIEDLLS